MVFIKIVPTKIKIRQKQPHKTRNLYRMYRLLIVYCFNSCNVLGREIAQRLYAKCARVSVLLIFGMVVGQE